MLSVGTLSAQFFSPYAIPSPNVNTEYAGQMGEQMYNQALQRQQIEREKRDLESHIQIATEDYDIAKIKNNPYKTLTFTRL